MHSCQLSLISRKNPHFFSLLFLLSFSLTDLILSTNLNLNRHAKTRLIMWYNADYQTIISVFKKYWYHLLGDQQVAKFITTSPSSTYCRIQSIWDILIHSDFTSGEEISLQKLGTFRSHKCRICPWILEGKHFFLPNRNRHNITQNLSCDTSGKIYLLTCLCGAFYTCKNTKPI